MTTRPDHHTGRDEQELADFFSGEYAGHMGLRCPLGIVLEYGTALPPSNRGSAPEPDARALRASEVRGHVLAALRALSPDERAVLAAAYTPHPYGRLAALRADYGDDRHVMLALAGRTEIDRLARERRAGDKTAARAAKDALKMLRARARRRLAAALSAYIDAAATVRQARREERLRRAARAVG